MSTRARKERKRAGIPFVKAPKTPTPPEERSYVTRLVPGPAGTKFETYQTPRSEKSVAKFLQKFTPRSDAAA